MEAWQHKSLMLFCSLMLLHCAQTRFSSSGPALQSPYANFGDRVPYAVTCQEERNTNTAMLKLPLDPKHYLFRVHNQCEELREEISYLGSGKKLHVVFVLDRTASMQENIDGVKGGVINFAKNLERDFWDVRFAAVGFRDRREDFLIIPFTTAEGLVSALEPWRAEGGGDFQEAGMEAIIQAHSLLSEATQADPKAKTGRNVIVYASDAAMYWGDDHNAFAVGPLAKLAKEWLSKDAVPLSFYSSLKSGINPAKDWGLKDAPTPQAQIMDLRKQSGLPGQDLSYPLNLDIMTDFAKEFRTITQQDPLLCRSENVSMQYSDPKSKELKVLSAQSTGDAAEKAGWLYFNLAPQGTSDYTLVISRCCQLKDKESSTDCAFRENRKLPVRFLQKP